MAEEEVAEEITEAPPEQFIAEPAQVMDALIKRSQADPLLRAHIDAAMWEAVARNATKETGSENKKKKQTRRPR